MPQTTKRLPVYAVPRLSGQMSSIRTAHAYWPGLALVFVGFFFSFVVLACGVDNALAGQPRDELNKRYELNGTKKSGKGTPSQTPSAAAPTAVAKPQAPASGGTESPTTARPAPRFDFPTETIERPAAQAETPSPLPAHPLTFDECARLAIKQSPYFLESALEIKSKEIDHTDSYWKLLPNIVLKTGYVLSTPNKNDNRYLVNFSSGSWDPVAAGFSIKATKLITEVAILGHIKAIATGLRNIGVIYMTINSLNQLIAAQEELISLAQQEKAYMTNLLSTGGTNPLEIRIAEQQIEVYRLERSRLESERSDLTDDLKLLLGADPDSRLELNLTDVRDQVMGRYSYQATTPIDVRNNNIDLRIAKHMTVISEYGIKLAYARFLPRLYLESRTADPIDNNTNSTGLYTSLGFNWEIWDWGERWRNLDRQRYNTKKARVKESLQEINLESDWRSAIASKERTESAMKLAKAQVELEALKKRQSEISYQAGTQPFPIYLSQIKEYFIARKNALLKELDDAKSEFALRAVAGDLYTSYIDPKSFE